jgi:hypothetical protein
MAGDPFCTSLVGPKRRLRGKHRYLRSVQRRAASIDIAPRPDSWWDLWHYHADWDGWGNHGWRLRRAHLSALATVFRTIASQSVNFRTPFQAWIFLSGTDAGTDATYLHTPNPNANNFPLLLPELRFESPAALHISETLQSILPGARAGEFIHPDPDRPNQMIRDFYVVAASIGLPLVP